VIPLNSYRVQRLEANGINYEPHERQCVVWGIHEGSASVIGIKFGDVMLARQPREEIHDLRIRAMREVIPTLLADALRDSKGKPVGYFVYQGLSEDHCKAVAEKEGKL
jgi:hypothetical protein